MQNSIAKKVYVRGSAADRAVRYVHADSIEHQIRLAFRPVVRAWPRFMCRVPWTQPHIWPRQLKQSKGTNAELAHSRLIKVTPTEIAKC